MTEQKDLEALVVGGVDYGEADRVVYLLSREGRLAVFAHGAKTSKRRFQGALEPFTTIRGRSKIGAGCTIRHSYLVECTIEDGATVGPFAYLRPGAVLRAGAKVGTFVEVKNSDIGPGAKVPHLSYVGDAEVGERSNLGAGSITANYDGREKHRTKIGKRVRGGVNTAYVAPVTVGDDTYTAAGSVITEDVPAGALAVARAKQRNVEGYSERAKGGRQERPLHSEEP